MASVSPPSSSHSGSRPAHVAVIVHTADRDPSWSAPGRLDRAFAVFLSEVCDAAREAGTRILTLLLPPEREDAPEAAARALLAKLQGALEEPGRFFQERGVGLRLLICRDGLTEELVADIKNLEGTGPEHPDLVLNLYPASRGQSEIARVAARLAREIRAGSVAEEDIDEEAVRSRLPTAGVPDPDLLISTSGRWHVSDTLLWEMAYTEIYVTNVDWPDFGRGQYMEALSSYERRERRFGRVTGR